MKRCPQCGKTHDDSVLACECGTDLQAVAPEVQGAQVEPAKPPQRAGRSGLLSFGILIAVLGGIALVLPLFGYELLLFRVIPTGDPIFGIAMIAIGAVLVVIDLVRKRSSSA